MTTIRLDCDGSICTNQEARRLTVGSTSRLFYVHRHLQYNTYRTAKFIEVTKHFAPLVDAFRRGFGRRHQILYIADSRITDAKGQHTQPFFSINSMGYPKSSLNESYNLTLQRSCSQAVPRISLFEIRESSCHCLAGKMTQCLGSWTLSDSLLGRNKFRSESKSDNSRSI